MNVYIKGLNACVMRKQKIVQYEDYLIANGHKIVPSPEDGNVILVWTCAFRSDHRDASVDKIQEYLTTYNDVKIVVTGCLPDISPELLNFSTRSSSYCRLETGY